MRSLDQLLIRCDPIRLAAIARLRGEELPSGSRREIVDAVAAYLTDPAAQLLVWEDLSEGEQEAVAALVSSDGGLPWLTFTRSWGEVRNMGPARLEREKPWEHPVSPAERLWYRGLVFRDVEDGPDGLVETAVLPQEMHSLFPATLPPMPEVEAAPSPASVSPADDSLLDDVCTMLAYLQSHQVRLTPEAELPARDQEHLARHLRCQSLERLAFLCHLVSRLELLRTTDQDRVRPDPEPVIAWLQAPAQDQRMTAAEAWRDDPTWNDLWHIPSLNPDDTGSWQNDPLRARQAFLRHLSSCRPGEWVSVSSLAAALKAADPDFQRPNGDYAAWYIRDKASGEYLSGFENWDNVEGALVHYLLTGPMAWLGLVDLGSEREGGEPKVFCLSAAGLAFLGIGGPAPKVESAPPLTVQADLVVLVPAARRYERFQLSRIADWVRTADPYAYRLTPSSLGRARKQAISVAKIKGFLEQASAAEIPRSARKALDRYHQRGAEARLERGVLLRVEDEHLLEQLATSPGTRRFIREVVGPTTALVARGDWSQLVRALAEEGILIDVVGLEGEDAP